MEILRSLESEILKIKGSFILLITTIGGLLLSIIFTLRFIFIQYHINLPNKDTGWEQIFSQDSRAFLGFMIPIGAMLICTLITQIEYGNNNWKQVHVTPQKFSTIFLSKFAILFFLTIFVFFVLNVGILIHGILPCLIIDNRFPIQTIPLNYFLLETLKCFVFTLPIISFQYLLSLHYKNFMVPIGIGLTVYVGTMPGIKLGNIACLSPYSFVLNYFDQVTTPAHFWMALIYFGILFIWSYFLYIYKGDKG